MTPDRWRAVDRVFQEALAREEPERAAFLAEIARNEELFVVPFDLAQLRVTGPPVTLADRVSEYAGAGEGAQFTVSDRGTLAYVPSDSRTSDRRMVWVDAGGSVQPLNSPPGAYTDPAISPDGRSVAVSIQGPTQTIWVYDLTRSTLTPLPSAGSSQSPTWTSDGHRLVYRGTRNGYRNLFWRSADGSNDEERLTIADILQTPASISDDNAVLFDQTSPDTGRDIWKVARRRTSRRTSPQDRIQRGASEALAGWPLVRVRLGRIRP